ncbi:flagellar biosynthesis protein FlhA [Dethiobacter alkaliphilus]|uniref:flagellar biosynthesis protein FlhA n=1 Tax=Dethiobacter alkaliphilus TaxID=427926 RepID=UPI002225EC4F|nr:flagellar biosynthesis protein FlhA [Dethiobacter alkaliphilus]MCW3488730.1 flagellar biosynthesis protein FlhA [Dethiobacter alkaliphilus]
MLQNADMFVAAAVIAVVMIIIIPIPPLLLDILLTFSIAFALITILLTLFTTETLQFAVFPSLLLVVTLFRLSLNISSTRLILSRGEAGNVIAAFGSFVAGSNYAVGLIIFIIITVIQFVVITNGAGRVAEVAARFTLDAMPGKQMSIDADFNAGLIDEHEARSRRKNLQSEADFYGAMDGASKFVRGDAIAGIVIVMVNILAGFAIGMIQQGMDLEQAIQTYILLTVGDGLVTQIPALLVSAAAGMLVTRSASEGSFGEDLSKQILGFPRVMILTSAILLILGLVPNIPTWPFIMLSAATGFAAYTLLDEEKIEQERLQAAEAREEEKPAPPENVLNLLAVEPLEIEIGYSLIPLTDSGHGGDLLDRITASRRQCALELGIVVQPIRIRDNLQLPPNTYIFKLKGNEIARGELRPGYYMAMNPLEGDTPTDLDGFPTREPTFGLPAVWVPAEKKDEAEMIGYTVVDVTTVMITHLTETIKTFAHDLLGRQEVKSLIDLVKEKQPAVIDELLPDLLTVGEIQKVLKNLLRERVPIRDLVTIFETLADYARSTREIDLLTEYVRQSLGRTICNLYAEDGKLYVISLDPRLEQKLADSLQVTAHGSYPVMDPQATQNIISELSVRADQELMQGRQPLVLTSSRIRLPFKRLTERFLPNLVVLSFNEIVPGVEVESVGMVSQG